MATETAFVICQREDERLAEEGVPGHALDIRHGSTPNGLTMRAACSCGEKIGRVTGANGRGISYSVIGSRGRFREHVEKVGAAPPWLRTREEERDG
jgi:hypothetical protein